LHEVEGVHRKSTESPSTQKKRFPFSSPGEQEKKKLWSASPRHQYNKRLKKSKGGRFFLGGGGGRKAGKVKCYWGNQNLMRRLTPGILGKSRGEAYV